MKRRIWAVLAVGVLLGLAIGLPIGLLGGERISKNSVGGSHVNQLDRCKPDDTTLACQERKHPSSGSIPHTNPPHVVKDGDAPGIDFAWSCPTPGTAGATFAISYLSYDYSKNWSRGCVDWWLNSGRKVGFVWETSENRATQGWQAGYDDAGTALSQSLYLIPGNTRPIFFAIDCDCSYGQVFSYFQGVNARIGVGRTGVYGGYYPVRDLFNAGLVRFGWQAYAWSYGNWDTRAQVEQWLNGDAWDYDRTLDTGDSGLYPPPAAPRPPDPYRFFPRARFALPYGQHASEYGTVKLFEVARCSNPVRRQVCKSSRWHLQLLRDRIVWVAHHKRTKRGWVPVKKAAWARDHLGLRLHRIQYDITQA